jgi:hypothetical protein
MNDREKRDFEAGLAEEVDAFLRGEPTRRTFIKLMKWLQSKKTNLSPFQEELIKGND